MNAYTQERLKEIEIRGYDIDFSQLTGRGWQIWKKVTLPILCGGLLLSIPIILIYLASAPFLTGMSYDELATVFQDRYAMQAMQAAQAEWDYKLKMLLFSAVISVLVAPITPGFVKMCYDADIHDRVNFGVMFKYYSPKYYGKILVVTALVFLMTSVPSILLQGIPILGPLSSAAISLTIHTFVGLAMPFIIFAEASPMAAIKSSFSIVSKNFFPVLGFNIVGALLGASGILVCCIGMVLSMAYFYITNYLLYKQIIGFENNNDLQNEFNATPSSMY